MALTPVRRTHDTVERPRNAVAADGIFRSQSRACYAAAVVRLRLHCMEDGPTSAANNESSQVAREAIIYSRGHY